MMATPDIIICEDLDALAVRAVDLIAQAASDAVRQRDRFALVLSGGSTPEKTYDLLARSNRAATIDWSRTYLFFGDERCVPPEDARSNFALAQRTLLARVPVPSTHVFAVPTWRKNAAEAAAEYADELARFFTDTVNATLPRFDLILLGLGDDGHTASLFPSAPTLRVHDAWVTWSPPGTLPPHVDRVTLTYPVLNAARQIVFLVAGDRKATVLHEILETRPTRDQCPAAGVRPVDGTVTWLVDRRAARLLTRRQ
jgi:6-phosphogluconolactonase